MTSVSVQGREIAYELEGPETAPVLTFSGSLGSSLAMWERQVGRARPYFRLLRYDHAGHGASSVPDAPQTIEDLSRDVLGLLDGLGIRKTHFVGLSMGGMVGMWLGANAPDRLDRLVACATSAHFPDKDTWNERIEAVNAHGVEAIKDAVIERWFSDAFRQNDVYAVDRASRMLTRTDPAGYTACAAAVRDIDLRGDLANVAVPTLVVAGSDDPVTPPAMNKAIADAVPGAAYAELPGRHMINIEAMDAFNDALLGFLQGKR